MTPMIDVVFLLIIFFLVSSHLAQQESHMELLLPTAKSGEESLVIEPERVVVNVKEDGTIIMAGRDVDRQQLEQRLIATIAENGLDVEVRIRSSRKALYESVEPVMLTCARVGIWNVTYSVYRKDGGRS